MSHDERPGALDGSSRARQSLLCPFMIHDSCGDPSGNGIKRRSVELVANLSYPAFQRYAASREGRSGALSRTGCRNGLSSASVARWRATASGWGMGVAARFRPVTGHLCGFRVEPGNFGRRVGFSLPRVAESGGRLVEFRELGL